MGPGGTGVRGEEVVEECGCGLGGGGERPGGGDAA